MIKSTPTVLDFKIKMKQKLPQTTFKMRALGKIKTHIKVTQVQTKTPLEKI